MLKKELRDQSAHALTAAVVLLPVLILPTLIGVPLSAFLCGVIREITEEGTPVTLVKIIKAVMTSKLDLVGWTIGGIILGVLAA